MFFLFLLLSIAMTWPLVLHLNRAVSYSGDPFFTTFTLHWDYYATIHRLPLFNAPIFYPDRLALAFSEHMYGVALLLFPLFAVGLPPLTVHNVAILLAFATTGYAAYLLARWATGSTPAAIIAGIVFAFVPYRFIHLPHLHFLWSMWLPLLLLALFAYVRNPRPRNAAFLCVAFVMNGLSSLHWLAFGSIATGATVVFLAVAAGRSTDRRFWIGLLVATGVAMCLLLPFTLPYIHVAKLYGMERLYTEAIPNSGEWADWLNPLPWNKLYGQYNRIGTQERALFPGFVIVGLALLGLVAGQRSVHGYGASLVASRQPGVAPSPWVIRLLDAGIVVTAVAAMLGRMRGHVALAGGMVTYDGVATPLFLLTVSCLARCWLRPPSFLGHTNAASHDWPERSRLPLTALCALLWVLVGALGARGLHGYLHTFLFEHVSMFRGIRVPIRWAMITYVGLSLLTAFGMARLLRNRSRVVSTLMTGSVAILLLLECRVAPLRWYMVPLGQRGVYAWLANTPLRGAVLELPLNQESAYDYMWRETVHHHPLINGVSSYTPRDYEDMAALYGQEPLPDAFLAELVRRRCSVIVVHEARAGPRVRSWLARQVDHGQLVFVRRFDAGTRGDYVFALTAVEPLAASWRAPEVPDPSGRTPTQNAEIFLRTGDWTYSGDPFALVGVGPLGTIHGSLTVSGWALAPAGVARVNLLFNNGSVIVPATATDRGDVTAKLPWYPKVTHAGFTATISRPPRGINGPTDLQLEVVDGLGHSRRNPPYWFHWYRAPAVVPTWNLERLDGLLTRLGPDAVKNRDRILTGNAEIQDFVLPLLVDPLQETDAAFVTRALTTILGTAQAPPIESRYLEMLGNHSTREQVLGAILESREFSEQYLVFGRVVIDHPLNAEP
ncbi:MAG TPA: hypothetical protein VEZ11_01510 [Thermoanaerobaculia bacterium]|nr:hypothetical protein [Thermoanaerobaculia bacterium]